MRKPAERTGQFVEVAGKLDSHQGAGNPRALAEPAIFIFRADNAQGARHVLPPEPSSNRQHGEHYHPERNQVAYLCFLHHPSHGQGFHNG